MGRSEGAVPSPLRSYFNPARLLTSAGECPLHARAIVILFSKPATQGMNYSYLLQFTKRRMRTFITIPSARNMNNTEDPP
jgi:hypothetical protein